MAPTVTVSTFSLFFFFFNTVMPILATMLLVHEGLLCSMNMKVITHLISLPLSLPEHGRPFEESLGSPSDGSAVSGHMQGPEELIHWPA